MKKEIEAACRHDKESARLVGSLADQFQKVFHVEPEQFVDNGKNMMAKPARASKTWVHIGAGPKP